MRRIKHVHGTLCHVYQRSFRGRILFYSMKDYLLFFTILCTKAVRYRVRILALSLMPDHFHIIVETGSHTQLASFMDVFTSLFAREFNIATGQEGHIFRIPFGMADKFKAKSRRSALLYVLNNPVEKKLSLRAEQYRWTFLEYSRSKHPFSMPLDVSRCRKILRNAVKLVEGEHQRGKHLSPKMLDIIFDGLDSNESEQLCDRIVSIYNVIDYDRATSFFDGYESMCLAASSNTGSEYEIREEFTPDSDTAYARLEEKVREMTSLRNPRDVVRLEAEVKARIATSALSSGIATPLQVKKYLRLPDR